MTLPVPPKSFVGSTYHAGDYRPNVNWHECLGAVNDAVCPIVEAYGGKVLDLTAEMDAVGGAGEAFIDQWHFTPAFHIHLAEALHRQARRLVRAAPGPGHVSHDYMLGSPDGPVAHDVILYNGEPEAELEQFTRLGPQQIMLYPDELKLIDNPRGNDRAEFEKQAVR